MKTLEKQKFIIPRKFKHIYYQIEFLVIIATYNKIIFFVCMSSLRNSSANPTKRCQSYVRKLNKQIQIIGDEVKLFNLRVQNSNAPVKIGLKSLSEPKYQHIILEQNLNPERPKIQPNTKISKLFKNCSTYSQNDFNFVNPSVLFGYGNSTIKNISEMRTTVTQMKLQKKLITLQKSWNRVSEYRIINQIGQSQHINNKKQQRVQSILKKIERQRPRTTSTARSNVLPQDFIISVVQ